ncbi:MAG: DNA-deoxyinosine glycosylase [Betaproteobacteria bacterium]|nr:DNA-deoxyinosine glycosylase [Betaproteobacteria bacterium]
MTRVRGFGPIANADAEILILGSMPSAASLAAGQYYAHPRNQFWPIAAELFGFDVMAPYRARTQALKAARIAVWDVLHSCVRRGSLDSSIEDAGLAVNDFVVFFARHKKIRHVLFNGAKAEQCYKRYVLPSVAAVPVAYMRLPSTSPANASLPFAAKLEVWRAAFEAVRGK